MRVANEQSQILDCLDKHRAIAYPVLQLMPAVLTRPRVSGVHRVFTRFEIPP